MYVACSPFLRYTIFASVFQFIIPLLIIGGIYILICCYLRVRALVTSEASLVSLFNSRVSLRGFVVCDKSTKKLMFSMLVHFVNVYFRGQQEALGRCGEQT